MDGSCYDQVAMKSFIPKLLALFAVTLVCSSCSVFQSPSVKQMAVDFLKDTGKAAAVEVADASLIVLDTKITEMQVKLDAYKASLPQPISLQDAAKLASAQMALKAARDARTTAAAKIDSLRKVPVLAPDAPPIAATPAQESWLQPLVVVAAK